MKFLMLSLLCFGMLGAVAETEPPKVGDPAPEWTLQDAEEEEHTLKALRGRVVFLILGNRKIRKEDNKWAAAFQKDYGESERVAAYIIGDLRSVPGFIPKAFIRRQLRKNPPPVQFLLDWKGEVHKQYRTEKEKPTLYLISQDGTIVFYRKSDFKKPVYAELKKAVETLLATPDPE